MANQRHRFEIEVIEFADKFGVSVIRLSVVDRGKRLRFIGVPAGVGLTGPFINDIEGYVVDLPVIEEGTQMPNLGPSFHLSAVSGSEGNG